MKLREQQNELRLKREKEHLERTQYYQEDLDILENKIMQCKARFDEIEAEKRKAKHEINSILLGRRVRFFDESVVYMIQDLHRKFVKCFRLRKSLKSFVEDKIGIFKQDEDAKQKDEDEEEEKTTFRLLECVFAK